MCELTYCENWKCKDKECLRHHVNQPFEVLTKQRMWTPADNGDCTGKILNLQK
jgi:hypothetical protein